MKLKSLVSKAIVKFSYWSKFHVNIFTGSRIIIMFVYKEFDEKSRNCKYLRLSFLQSMESG